MKAGTKDQSIGRLLLAVGVVLLFAAAVLGFSALHNHDDATGQATHQCLICLAHATASIAIVADGQVVVEMAPTSATPFFAAADIVISHVPLTADCRGPPPVL